VLRGVDLGLERGEVHALLGLNGSGKTSLAYSLMGLAGYEPDRGTIVFDGSDITGLPVSERAQMGITLSWQRPARFEGLVVADYLALGMARPTREGVEGALEAVGLSPAAYMGREVGVGLSGGERKRIELAAVYAMEPQLAVLDEPDSGVDVLCLADIATLVRRMADNGASVLLITHHRGILDVADRASLMCAGRIARTGKPAELHDYFAQRCRPHGDRLGSQPWGPDAGGTYEQIMSDGVCEDGDDV
jgi:Fe-S cluster assembly ATP-binding protein